jgi:hypothetical protein
MEDTEQQQRQQLAAQIVPDVHRAVAEQVCSCAFSARLYLVVTASRALAGTLQGLCVITLFTEQLHTVHTTQQ